MPTLEIDLRESTLISCGGSIFLVGKHRALTSPLSLSSLLLFPSNRWGGRNPLRRVRPPPGYLGRSSRPHKGAQGARKGRSRIKFALTALSFLPAVPCAPRQFTRLRNFFVSRYSLRILRLPTLSAAPPRPPGV